MTLTVDEELLFVLRHPRFRHMSNDLTKGVPGGEWTIKIADDGHVITVVGSHEDAIRRAASALRRLP